MNEAMKQNYDNLNKTNPNSIVDSGADDLGSNFKAIIKRMWSNRSIKIVVAVYAILVLILFFARFINNSYGSFGFVRTVLSLSIFTAVVAFGQGLVVLTGGFDLSIPGAMTLPATMLTAMAAGSNSRTLWVLPLVLAVGGGIGAFNGIGIAILGLSPIVMTLATNTILGGCILLYTHGTPTGFTPKVIVNLVNGHLFGGGVPEVIVVLVLFTAGAVLLQNYSSFGRRVYAVGSNPIVASLSGIRTRRVIIWVYITSGICAAFGGVLLCGFSGQSYLGLGDPYLLLSLAGVVVGGSAVKGGRGYYLGTLAGVIILTTVSTILGGTNLSEGFKQIIYAIVIIVAVVAVRHSD
jgi:ribose transport system permease protein